MMSLGHLGENVDSRSPRLSESEPAFQQFLREWKACQSGYSELLGSSTLRAPQSTSVQWEFINRLIG